MGRSSELEVERHFLEFSLAREAMAAQEEVGPNGDAVMAALWQTHRNGGTIFALGLDSDAATLAGHFQEEAGARYTAGAKKVPQRPDREAVRSTNISEIISKYPYDQIAARLAGYCSNPADTLLVYCTGPVKDEVREALLRGVEGAKIRGVHVSVLAPQCERSLLGAGDTQFSIPTANPLVAAGIIENLMHAQCEGMEVEHRNLPCGSPDRTGLFPRMLRETAEVEQRLAKDPSFVAGIINAREAILDRLEKGGCVYVAGNGGSACDSIQLADLIDARPLPSGRYARVDKDFLGAGYLTCCVNDGFSPFPRGMESVKNPNDIFIGYTTSGKSQNIIESVQAANEKGVLSVVFAGYDGGPIKGMANYEFIVPWNETGLVQVVHWTTGSALINW